MPDDITPTHPLQFFPVDIGHYQHHPNIDTATEVSALVDLLSDFGAEPAAWDIAQEDRGIEKVHERLAAWANPEAPTDSFLYWTGHGEASGKKAYLAHAHSQRPVGPDSVSFETLERYIENRQGSRNGAGTWAIVVIDACRSAQFVELLSAQAYPSVTTGGPRGILLIATSEDGGASLGTFRETLANALEVGFPTNEHVNLWDLAGYLKRNLRGCPVIPLSLDGHEALHRREPPIAGKITTSLDQLPEIKVILAALSDDERRHFLPKASGAELGEQSWYFEGREAERDQILAWLETVSTGMLVVAGAAGSGKSALLGHILVHTRRELREALERTGHLTPSPDVAWPQDPFNAVIHLSGVTPQDLIRRIALAADLGEPPAGRPLSAMVDWLTEYMLGRGEPFTLLLDALDEAHLPVIIADLILAPLAAVRGVRVVVGTRRSTREGPDEPAPNDQDLIEALGTDAQGLQESRLTVVTVARDHRAMVSYVRRRLTAAARAGAISIPDEAIERVARGIGELDREFLYARLAVHEVLQSAELASDPRPLFAADHRQLFARAVSRMAARHPTTGPLLAALAVAQGQGLPVRDGIWATVAASLSGSVDGTITDFEIEALIQAAAPYLMIGSEFGQTVYRLAHRTFSEYFWSQATEDDRAGRRRSIARALLSVPASRPGSMNPYLVHYLAKHIADAGAWDELAASPQALDGISPHSVAEFVLSASRVRTDWPASIFATAAARRVLASAAHGDRALIRAVEMAGRSPADPETIAATQARSTGPLRLSWARVPRRPPYITLTSDCGGVRAMAPVGMPNGGTLLAIGDPDGKIWLWNPFASRPVQEPLVGHVGQVTALACLPIPGGPTLLASGGIDKTLRLWDLRTGRPHGGPLGSDIGEVRALAALPVQGGERMLLAHASHRYSKVWIWDPLAGRPAGEPAIARDTPVAAIIPVPMPDGSALLATAGRDHAVRLWDPATGQPVGKPLTGHTQRVHCLTVISMPGRPALVASYAWDNTIRLWDPLTGDPVARYPAAHTGRITALAALEIPGNATLLASAGDDDHVQLRDPLTGSPALATFNGHTDAVLSLAVIPTGNGQPPLIASGSQRGSVYLWYPGTAQDSEDDPGVRVSHLAVMHSRDVNAGDERPVLAAAHPDAPVSRWDTTSGEPVGSPVNGLRRTRALTALTVPGWRTVLAGTRGLDIRLWDPEEQDSPLRELSGHTDMVMALSPVPMPHGIVLLASGGADNTVRLWDPRLAREVRQPFAGHIRRVGVVLAFTLPDSGRTIIASGGDDHKIWLWDPDAEGQKGTPLHGHTAPITSLTTLLMQDGSLLLASGSADRSIRLWAPDSGASVGLIMADHDEPITAMAAVRLPDGRTLLAATGGQGTLYLLDPETRELLHTVSVGIQLDAMVSTGGRLAVGSSDGLFVLDLMAERARHDPGAEHQVVAGERAGSTESEDLTDYHAVPTSRDVPVVLRSLPFDPPRGASPLLDHGIEARLNLRTLEPEQAMGIRQWLRVALTHQLCLRDHSHHHPVVSGEVLSLFRYAGRATVDLSLRSRFMNDLAGMKDKASQDILRVLSTGIYRALVDDLNLTDMACFPDTSERKWVAGQRRAQGRFIACQMIGALSLLGFHEIIEDILSFAIQEALKEIGTFTPVPVTFTDSSALSSQAMANADELARTFDLPYSNQYFEQALVGLASHDGSKAPLLSLGTPVLADQVARTAARTILADPATRNEHERIPLPTDFEPRALAALADQLDLQDLVPDKQLSDFGILGTLAKIDALHAVLAAAFLSYQGDGRVLARNLPKPIGDWLKTVVRPVPVTTQNAGAPAGESRKASAPARSPAQARNAGPSAAQLKSLAAKHKLPPQGLKVYKSQRGEGGGLVLTRTPGERVVIGDEVTVEILQVVGDKVRLGIKAPKSMPVDREEIREKRKTE